MGNTDVIHAIRVDNSFIQLAVKRNLHDVEFEIIDDTNSCNINNKGKTIKYIRSMEYRKLKNRRKV